jgi:hypothetical protein
MSSVKEIEQKEWLDRARFTEVLREWLGALDRNEDFSLVVNGQSFDIPAAACEAGKFRLEYEIDEGEHEFELTLKWR